MNAPCFCEPANPRCYFIRLDHGVKHYTDLNAIWYIKGRIYKRNFPSHRNIPLPLKESSMTLWEHSWVKHSKQISLATTTPGYCSEGIQQVSCALRVSAPTLVCAFAENQQKPLKMSDLTGNFTTFESFELIDLYTFHNGKYQNIPWKLSEPCREQI